MSLSACSDDFAFRGSWHADGNDGELFYFGWLWSSLAYISDNVTPIQHASHLDGASLHYYLISALHWLQCQIQSAAQALVTAWDAGNVNFSLPRSVNLALIGFHYMVLTLWDALPSTMDTTFYIPQAILVAGFFKNNARHSHPFNLDAYPCFTGRNDSLNGKMDLFSFFFIFLPFFFFLQECVILI